MHNIKIDVFNVLFKQVALSIFVFGSLVLSGCSVLQQNEYAIQLNKDSTFVVLPFRNLAQTPQAGQKTASLVSALLRTQGLKVIDSPQSLQSSLLSSDLLADDEALIQDAFNWANQSGAQYGVSGSVDEWRYKSGLDGEPAVGITLNVIELKTGNVIWTSTGARTGWGREGVAMAARTLLTDLLSDLPVSQQ